MSINQVELQDCYDSVVRSTYEEIYNIDLTTGDYVLVHCLDHSTLKQASQGNFDELTQYILNEFAHPNDKYKSENHKIITINDIANTLSWTNTPFIIEHKRLDKDNKYCWYEVSFVKVKDKNIAICFVRNIDVKKKRQEEYIKKERRYDMFLRDRYDFICDINVASGQYHVVLADDSMTIPLEGDLDEMSRLSAETILHPDDREWYVNNLSLENLIKYFKFDEEFNYEFRCINDKGELTYHEFIGRYYSGDKAEDDSIILVGRDITKNKEVENITTRYQLLEQQYTFQQQLVQNVTRYNNLITDTNTILFEWDVRGELLYVSPNWDTKFGSGKTVGKELERELLNERKVHPDDYLKFKNMVANADNFIDNQEVIVRLMDNSSKYIWCRLFFKFIYDENKKPIKLSGIVTDIDDIVKQMGEILGK